MEKLATIPEQKPQRVYSATVHLLNECPLCKSTDHKPVKTERNNFPNGMHDEVLAFNNTWIQLLKCNDCSFRFTKEIPNSPTFFQNRYDNKWFNPEEEVKSFRKSQILEDIFGHFNKLKKKERPLLLDVGSFAGKLLYFADKEGYEPEGVEVNPKLAKFSENKLGFKVWCSELQKVELPQDRYNFVTIIDVLEHLTEPDVVLKVLHGSMVSGGHIYIKVPNGPMQILKQNIANFLRISPVGMFASFAHINHFNVKSLERILNTVGFDLVTVEMSRSEKWGKDKSLYWLRNALRTIVHQSSTLAYKLLGLPLGFNLNIIARKR